MPGTALRDGRKAEMTTATLAPMTTIATATTVTFHRSRGARLVGVLEGGASGIRTSPASGSVASGTLRAYPDRSDRRPVDVGLRTMPTRPCTPRPFATLYHARARSSAGQSSGL